MKKLSDDAIQMLNDRAEERKDLAKTVPYLVPILLFVSSFYLPMLWFITGPLILFAVVWLFCIGCKKLYDKIKSEANFLVDLVGWSLFIVGSICLLIANGELL